MRRGLMAWDADEIPIGILKQRVQRLQSAMAAAGQDAILLYTNFIRSGAVSYLTAFSPYWADGVLLVPQQGEPIFATTLSKRVGSWIQSVKPVGELVTSPAPGTVLGQKLAAGGGIRRRPAPEPQRRRDRDPQRAIGELRKVLDRDIHHAPAYRLLASFYSRTGDTERANRVLTALDLLGFAEDADRATMQRLKTAFGAGERFNPCKAFPTTKGCGEVHSRIVQAFGADAYV